MAEIQIYDRFLEYAMCCFDRTYDCPLTIKKCKVLIIWLDFTPLNIGYVIACNVAMISSVAFRCAPVEIRY